MHTRQMGCGTRNGPDMTAMAKAYVPPSPNPAVYSVWEVRYVPGMPLRRGARSHQLGSEGWTGSHTMSSTACAARNLSTISPAAVCDYKEGAAKEVYNCGMVPISFEDNSKNTQSGSKLIFTMLIRCYCCFIEVLHSFHYDNTKCSKWLIETAF